MNALTEMCRNCYEYSQVPQCMTVDSAPQKTEVGGLLESKSCLGNIRRYFLKQCEGLKQGQMGVH